MGQVLYRKYRSKNLSEVLGQTAITTALNNAIKTNRIAHAYLFTGPRGVGKTSTARILAHEVNNFPYSDDSSHIDIIEIDAASNRRIDEIRELREKVYITPSVGKYKVYIIDEVHMLTKEAFNALLKTLEEPPEHVIFILATTDVHKLPDTIISRTQRYSFKPISVEDISAHLKDISKKEKFKISDEAIKLLAEKGQGSFRDSISLLDQISSSKSEIDEEDVVTFLGIPSTRTVAEIVTVLEESSVNYKELNEKLTTLIDQGFSPSDLANTIMEVIRTKLINSELKMNEAKAINLLNQLLDVQSSVDPKNKLLLVLISNLDNTDTKSIAQPESSKKIKEIKIEQPKILKEITKKQTDKPIKENIEALKPSGEWNEVLNDLKKTQNTIYAIVKSAKEEITDNLITLTFDYPFHQRRMNESKNKEILLNTVGKHFDKNVKLELLVDTNKKNNISTVNQLFGEAEIEEL